MKFPATLTSKLAALLLAPLLLSACATANLPAPIVKRLSAEVQAALRTPAVARRLEQQALIPVVDTPEEFAAELRKEREHWGQFIKAHNITQD